MSYPVRKEDQKLVAIILTMKTDLNKLAAELARMDDPESCNFDVIAAESIIAALGKKLRSVGWMARLKIFWAIFKRAGK